MSLRPASLYKRLDAHFKRNLPTYIANHPGEYVLLAEFKGFRRAISFHTTQHNSRSQERNYHFKAKTFFIPQKKPKKVKLNHHYQPMNNSQNPS